MSEEQTPISKVDDTMTIEDVTGVEAPVLLGKRAISVESAEIVEESVAKDNDLETVEIKEIDHASANRTGAEHVSEDRNRAKVGTTDVKFPPTVENAKQGVIHGKSNVNLLNPSGREIDLDRNDLKDELKGDDLSDSHDGVQMNPPLLPRVLDPTAEASAEHHRVPHGENAVRTQIPVENPTATCEEYVGTHPSERTLDQIPMPLDIPTDGGLHDDSNGANMRTSGSEGVNDISNAACMQYAKYNGLDKGIQTQAGEPVWELNQENTGSLSESNHFSALQDKAILRLEETLAKVNDNLIAKEQELKRFAALQDKALLKLGETLANVNDTLTAKKQDADLLMDLRQSVR
jgi:hypothetical protein